MKIYALIGHQREKSFCHALLATAIEQMQANGHEVICHDLYAEKFDPILHESEIVESEPLAAEIQRHCDEITEADGYFVIHPNWWGQPPAILKGWIDRVLRQGVAYHFGEHGPVGHLKDKTALVITTSNTPREAELAAYGDPLENLWKNCIFGMCGLTDFTRRNFESIVMSTPEERQTWLEEVGRLVNEKFPAK